MSQRTPDDVLRIYTHRQMLAMAGYQMRLSLLPMSMLMQSLSSGSGGNGGNGTAGTDPEIAKLPEWIRRRIPANAAVLKTQSQLNGWLRR